MADKSKFFRIAVEGDTTDGRAIERRVIEQIVKNFNRAKYGARVWLEHMRGLLPDSPFKSYGDVLAVKAEEIDLGDGKNKLALFAQIDATPELVAMNKARQKIYTSCEINPDFARSGEAYLVGLAVTDSPASLGTEILQFAANAQANPLADRKQNPDNLFTAAQETTLEFEAQPAPGDTLLSKVKDLLGLGQKDTDQRFADVGKAVEAIALSQQQSNTEAARIGQDVAALGEKFNASSTELAEFKAEFAALVEKLSQTGDTTGQRPPATGGDGRITTDC